MTPDFGYFRHPRWRVWLGFFISVAGVMGTLWARLLIGFESTHAPGLVLFFIPVLLSAYVGGLWPGLAATALTAVTTNYFLLGPPYSFAFGSSFNVIQWFVLLISSVLLTALTEALHRSRGRAEASRALLEKIAATIPGAIYAWQLKDDGSSVFQYVSSGIEQIRGRSPDELGHENLFNANFLHPDDRARIVAALHVSAEKGTPFVERFRTIHSSRGEIWVSARSNPERQPDGTTIWYGIVFDVSERMILEDHLRRAQRLEAVGQLTGGVAHDFNNLLAVLSGNIELLGEAVADDPDLADLAQDAIEAIDRGASLTRSLLAFSRRQPLEPGAINANLKIGTLLPMLRRTLGETIDIAFLPGHGIWSCEVDSGQLQNAIVNLAINARDAMSGGGKLTIETANIELDEGYTAQDAELQPGSYVVLAVSDTGCGMDALTIAKAFEPFFSTKGVGKGSGLGLSMVYGFIKQSKGHVSIYSEVGEGTTLKLYLPRFPDPETPEAPAPHEIQKLTGTETILVVEDDNAMRTLTVKLLRSLGYTPISAATGFEALALLAEHPSIALILTDIVLPGGMKARELSAAARIQRPDIKILYMSGYTENAIIHHGRLIPGLTLLQKPFRQRELSEKVRKVLDETIDNGYDRARSDH